MSEQVSINSSSLYGSASTAKGDVLVRAENIGKIFCRDFKKSLLYGVCDALHEFFPFPHDKESLPSSGIMLRPSEFWANREISFEVRRGECLGLIGRNGAGKTTLLRMLNGLIKPDSGFIEVRGRVGAIIALGAGFNPVLTGRENVYVNGSLLGLSKKEIDGKIDDIIDFAEIGEFIDSPVQSYSSGMQVRLGFAVATAMDPDVLILDEVLAVGDLSFRSKCLKRIGQISRNSAILFVSHELGHVTRICDRVLLLERGVPHFYGATDEGLSTYQKLVSSEVMESEAPELHPAIDYFRPLTQEGGGLTETGGALCIHFEISSREEIPVGSCNLFFMSHQRIIEGQADFSSRLSAIPKGHSRISMEIPRVDLAAGHYLVNVQIFAKGGREVVVHSFGSTRVHVIGPQRVWCGYRMPVERVDIVPYPDR